MILKVETGLIEMRISQHVTIFMSSDFLSVSSRSEENQFKSVSRKKKKRISEKQIDDSKRITEHWQIFRGCIKRPVA